MLSPNPDSEPFGEYFDLTHHVGYSLKSVISPVISPIMGSLYRPLCKPLIKGLNYSPCGVSLGEVVIICPIRTKFPGGL